MTVIAPNKVTPDHLAEVMAEMMVLGAPTIKAFDTGELYRAVEGSHRLHAAVELGLTIYIDVVTEDDEIGHDFDDVDGCLVSDVLDYLELDGVYLEIEDEALEAA